jgi:hypothetical protein
VNVVKEKWVLPARNRWIQLASPRLRCLQGWAFGSAQAIGSFAA